MRYSSKQGEARLTGRGLAQNMPVCCKAGPGIEPQLGIPLRFCPLSQETDFSECLTRIVGYFFVSSRRCCWNVNAVYIRHTYRVWLVILGSFLWVNEHYFNCFRKARHFIFIRKGLITPSVFSSWNIGFLSSPLRKEVVNHSRILTYVPKLIICATAIVRGNGKKGREQTFKEGLYSTFSYAGILSVWVPLRGETGRGQCEEPPQLRGWLQVRVLSVFSYYQEEFFNISIRCYIFESNYLS